MRIVGILNVTPDSFSDGGRHRDPGAAIAHGERLFDEGAHVVDVGGESTRPGAAAVPVDEERARVVPVVAALARRGPVSVDTRHAVVARAALDAGATWINDVSGGGDPDMFPLAADARCQLVVMHMRGTPSTMTGLTDYTDVCEEVWAELAGRVDAAFAAGVDATRLLWDPGIGFAKTAAQSLALLRDLPARTAGRRVYVGASRKSFLAALTGQAVAAERVEGSLAVALHCRDAGVAALRVHDVAATVRALRVWEALR